mmetsp:Transcript_15193/g.43432  ORF Transcript_15193/g.43432 Transcript_15193/m.43432 type:complete len:440 (+) Transcript_15193:32-1351(+)
MFSLGDCHFALPRITLAIAGSGCDVINTRLVSHAWHAALRQHFANGLLDDVRLRLNIDTFIAELKSRFQSDDSEDSEEEYYNGGSQQRRRPSEMTLLRPGSGGEVTSKVFSPCGSKVTLVTADSQIRTIDVATGRMLQALVGHTGVVQALSYSPCARFMLTASMDGTARVWNVSSGAEVKSFASPSGPLYDAVFSPCGGRILASSFGGEAILWDLQTGEELHRMQGHASVVFSCDFSPDGCLVLTTSKDGSARLWDAGSGEVSCTLGLQGTKLRGATFTPCDALSVLAVGEDGVMVLWGAPEWEEVQRWSGRRIAAAAFSPCADRIVATTRDCCVWLLSADFGSVGEAAAEVCLYQSETYEMQLAGFSPCGRFVLTGSAGITGTVRLWDAASLQELCAYEVSPGVVSGVNKVGFSPCGSRVLAATYNGTVLAWGRGPAF